MGFWAKAWRNYEKLASRQIQAPGMQRKSVTIFYFFYESWIWASGHFFLLGSTFFMIWPAQLQADPGWISLDFPAFLRIQ